MVTEARHTAHTSLKPILYAVQEAFSCSLAGLIIQ